MAVDLERMLDAIEWKESAGDALALSLKGAQGAYQLMPATAKELGVNPFDKKSARGGAAKHFSRLMTKYANDLPHALAAWNWGEGNVDRQGLDKAPKETRDFVQRVMTRYSGPPSKPAVASAGELFPGESSVLKAPRSADAGELWPGESGLLGRSSSQNEALKDAVVNAPPTDKAARIYNLQIKTGLPVPVIERNLDELEKRAAEAGFDAETFRKESPLLARWLAEDPTRAGIAKGDHEHLRLLEKAWPAEKEALLNPRVAGGKIGGPAFKRPAGEIKAVERSLLENVTEPFKRGLAQLRQYITLFGRRIYDEDEQQDLQLRLAKQQRNIEKYPVPEKIAKGQEAIHNAETFSAGLTAIMQNPHAALETSVQSLASSLPAVVGNIAALPFGPAARGIGTGLGSFGVEYAASLSEVVAETGMPTTDPNTWRHVLSNEALLEKAKEKGLKRGLTIGVFDGITAGFAGKLLSGAKPTAASIAPRVVGELGLQGAGGAAGEATAQAITSEKFRPGEILMEALIELPTALVEVPGNVRMARGAAILEQLPSGPKVAEAFQEADKAEKSAAFLQQLGDTVTSAKTAQAAPEAMNSFITALKEEGSVKNVFVPIESWNGLFQSEAPKIAGEVFGSLRQYSDAVQTGGDLVIPIELYAQKIAGTQFHQTLIPKVRLSPGDMTLEEAAELDNLTPAVTATLEAEYGTVKAQETPNTRVFEDVFAKLRATGTDTVAANRDALLWREYYRARAERLGVDAWTLYSEDPLNIQREIPTSVAANLKVYNQELAEPAVPHAERRAIPGGEITLPPAEQHEIVAAKEALTSAKASERDAGVFGATIHPVKGNLAGQPGVAVAGYPQRGVVVAGYPNDEEIVRFQQFNRDIFQADKRAALGIWVDSETGKGYLDIVNVLPREEAIAQGEYLGEKAVFDLENFEEIRLPVQHVEGQRALFQGATVSSLQDEGRLYYHASPLPQFSGSTKDAISLLEAQYDALVDEVANVRDERLKRIDKQIKALQTGQRAGGNAGGATAQQFYATSQPQAWMDVQVDELGTDYSQGGVYAVVLKKGQQETLQPAGMGQELPETIVDAEDVEKILGPFPSKADANKAVSQWLRETTTYYQGGKRGMSVPVKRLIVQLRKADPSTFVHESAHLWLEDLRLDAFREGVNPQVIKDWVTIRDWIGATDKHIPDAAHEKFARGVEAYVMEGKAPSFALREAFAQLKEWLVRIYKSMRMLDVELTDEVHDVFDRLLATDAAIKEMRERSAYHAPLLDPSLMTPEEYEAYRELNETAKLEAEEELRVKVMKELRRESTAEWRKAKEELEPKVREELMEAPLHRAAFWLKTGHLPDGVQLPSGRGITHKLDKQALIRMMRGEKLTDKLPFKYADNGMHPDVVAEAFGLSSGQQMIHDILELPPLKELVDTEVTARLKAERGDLIFDGTLEDKAAELVQSDRQADVFNFELRVLRRLGARREGNRPAALKDLAKKMIRRYTVGELDPKVFESAARKAQKEAEEALAGRDMKMGTARNLEVAFDAKQRQMLNLFLHREASAQKAAVEKKVKQWDKIFSRNDDKLAKRFNMDMVNAARAVAATHGLFGSDETADHYMTQLKQYDQQSYDDLADLVRVAAGNGARLDDMTLDDFAIMRDAIDGLLELARASLHAEIDGKKVLRSEIVGKLNETIIELTGGTAEKAGYHKAISDSDKFKRGLMGARSMLRRVEHWADAMDGGDPNGVFRKFIWQPVSEAADTFRDNRVKVMEKYLALTKKLEGTVTRDKIAAPELQYEFSGKAELLGALLHTGNESNMQKLLRGREWGFYDQTGTLDTSRWDAFFKRAQTEGIITKKDMDFVQGVWDLLESLKPGAQHAHKRIFGYFFDEITAWPVETNFGTYKGGYFPAVTDTFIVEDAQVRADKAALESHPSSFLFPSTMSRGTFMKRVEGYAKPLALDAGLIPQHIEKVLRFTHLEPIIRDIGRVAMDRNFRDTLALLDPTAGPDMLVPWLQRTAQQIVETPSTTPTGRWWDARWRSLRHRTGLQLMAANVSVALQQFTGITLAAVKVKPRYLAAGLWRFMSDPSGTTDTVSELSAFMRTRSTTNVIEVQKAIDAILLDPTPYQKAKAFAMQHGYFFQTATQGIVDKIVWMGAYEQALAAEADPKSAIRRADSAVRETQGTFAPEDISKFEAGSAWMRTFSMFYSYFNMAANLNATEFVKAWRQGGFGGAARALYVYAFGLMIPAVIAEAIVRAMSGDLDDEDDDGYTDDLLGVFFGGQARMVTAMVPVLGPVAQTGINQFNDKWYDDRISTSPAVSALEAMARLPYDAYKLAAEDDPRLKRPIQDVMTTLGIATGMPFGAVARPLGYIADVEQGYAEPDNPADAARGLISGKAPQK